MSNAIPDKIRVKKRDKFFGFDAYQKVGEAGGGAMVSRTAFFVKEISSLKAFVSMVAKGRVPRESRILTRLIPSTNRCW